MKTPQTNRKIDYYYVPISGYAYLGEQRLVALAAQFATTINFLPVNIGRVFSAAQVIAPAAQSSVRVAYRRRDMARIARRLKLPINVSPTHWPVDPSLACRVIFAAKHQGVDPHLVSFALLSAVYAEQRNIADENQVSDLLDSLHLDASALISLANEQIIGDAFQAATDNAIALGVPGSPTYIVDQEMFFGQDRLLDLESHLAYSPA